MILWAFWPLPSNVAPVFNHKNGGILGTNRWSKCSIYNTQKFLRFIILHPVSYTHLDVYKRQGTSAVIFGYNGRDGVVTDANGLIYMRARYYSPDMKRFVNADVIAGQISNAITLNRYAYANGNPVSFVDPFGLSAERRGNSFYRSWDGFYNAYNLYSNFSDDLSMYQFMRDATKYGFYTKKVEKHLIIKGAKTPVALKNGINGTRYALKKADDYWDVFKNVNVKTGLKSEFFLKTPKGKFNGGAILNYTGIAIRCV